MDMLQDVLKAAVQQVTIVWFVNVNTIQPALIAMNVFHFTMINHGEEQRMKIQMHVEVNAYLIIKIIYHHHELCNLNFIACNCNGFSDRCFFDQKLYEETGHGGHCSDCRGNRDGPNCERCRINYYQRSDGYCIPCHCNDIGKKIPFKKIIISK